MRTRDVRRACHARLAGLRERGLVLPRPFDAEELSRRVGACLGRPVTLIAMPMPSGAPYGVTLFTDDGHIVAYEERTSRFHQGLIIAHELGHILFDHRTVALDDDQASQLLMPALRPTLVRQVVGRTGVYSRREEREAETMATVLIEESGREADDGEPAVALRPDDVELYDRLRGSFEHPDR